MICKDMKNIIEPIDRILLKNELTPERRLRKTNKASNEVYAFTAAEAPMLMREVGRLREEAFRASGGGTGEEIDIDEEDLVDNGYCQLIVWDPEVEEIVGGYRFIVSVDQNPKHLSTEHYFKFNDKFREEYLPYTIELGRSFVQIGYQVKGRSKSIYALDNLWDGLGALMVLNPHVKYLFGKVTMYTTYNVEARNTLIWFLNRYFPDNDRLITAKESLEFNLNNKEYEALFIGETYRENYHILLQKIRKYNEVIPPIINAYMNLSESMKVFDTFLNTDFGEVEETGILITIADLYADKSDRYRRWDGWDENLENRTKLFKEHFVTK